MAEMTECETLRVIHNRFRGYPAAQDKWQRAVMKFCNDRITELEAAEKEAQPFAPEGIQARLAAVEELIEPISQRETNASVQHQNLSLRIGQLEEQFGNHCHDEARNLCQKPRRD